jgi:hypothetical protein
VCVAGQCVFQGQGGPADAGPDAGPPTCALNGVSGVAAILVDRPLGYWRLGEDAGKLAADAIVGSPSGMYGASIALGLPGLWGYPGDVAASLPGGSFTPSSVVQVAQSDALQPDGGLTIEAWFRLGTPPPDQPGEVPSLVHQGSTLGPPPFTLDLDPLASQIHFFVNTAGGLRSLSSATPLHEGSAFHVVATFDGSTLALYLDGAIDAKLAGTSSAILGYDGTSGLTFGGDPDQPDRPAFAGLLEDVAIYGAALSPARIEAHYQAAASGCVPQAALPDGGPDGGLNGGADAGADGGLEDGGTGDAGWEDAGEGGMLGDSGPLDAGGDGGAADAGA